MIINTKLDLFKYGTPPKQDRLSDKEMVAFQISSPTKKQHERAFSMGRSLLKVPEAEKNKMAEQWMHGGGRDPKGRSLDEEIKLGKEEWLKKRKEEQVPKKNTASLLSNVKNNALYKLLDNPKVMGVELGHEGIMEVINLLQRSGMLKEGGKVK